MHGSQLYNTFCSYLKTLLGPFNEIVNKYVNKLKPLADGTTIVPMKIHFGELALEVISKVYESKVVFVGVNVYRVYIQVNRWHLGQTLPSSCMHMGKKFNQNWQK